MQQAIEDYVETLQRAGALHISVTSKTVITRLPEEIELGVLSVVQELLQNTLRHSGAASVHIELMIDAHALTVRYTDDGIGLKTTAAHTRIGMKHMQSRVQALNGYIDFDTREVLRLICLEKKTSEIGEDLFISPRTVEGHRIQHPTKNWSA